MAVLLRKARDESALRTAFDFDMKSLWFPLFLLFAPNFGLWLCFASREAFEGLLLEIEGPLLCGSWGCSVLVWSTILTPIYGMLIVGRALPSTILELNAFYGMASTDACCRRETPWKNLLALVRSPAICLSEPRYKAVSVSLRGSPTIPGFSNLLFKLCLIHRGNTSLSMLLLLLC